MTHLSVFVTSKMAHWHYETLGETQLGGQEMQNNGYALALGPWEHILVY